MMNEGKRNLLGVLVDAVDYEYVVSRTIEAARKGTALGVSALAVHGVMTGVGNSVQRYRLNRLEIVTPDGQPVRWLMNILYGTRLRDRVYGPRLTAEILRAAAAEGLPVFLYGSSKQINEALRNRLEKLLPALTIAGAEPSAFRTLEAAEREALLGRIRESGARLVFIGLGCPKQEVFVYENREALSMPVLAVGAAFDYLAGVLREPPETVQRLGLQWLYRLFQQPKRLAKRYLILNAKFTVMAAAQWCGIWRPDPLTTNAPSEMISHG
ncbi:MAG TPA: WecB/TagA/CpsF family glycosyltransferase [Bryobacteraceae bacterium]|jgi:exopolysaccharide biosynthesis WecB/TagA/CpsF family protein|nr:WecB/TagA/CpsF family glycosyltransferase [Bryobacteraceae bacterium]